MLLFLCNIGFVYVWGCNDPPQLGLGPVKEHKYEPALVEDLKKRRVVYVSAGSYHSAALTGIKSLVYK